MKTKFFAWIMAPVIFLVTVGIPVFHHRCETEMSSSTQWFIFNESHCEEEGAPPCCKKEKSDCCSVDSEIIALKMDQEFDQQFYGFSFFSWIIAVPSYVIEGFHATMASFNPSIERIFPPPKLAYGRRLLNLFQVFMI